MEKEILLKVEHLCKYFTMSHHKTLKAVDEYIHTLHEKQR